MAVVGPGTVVGSPLVVGGAVPVHWAADLSQANCVAAGFVNDSFQRQNNAGTFNDNTVPWPVPTGPATSPRPGRSLTFTIPSGYRRYEVVPNHAAQEAGDTQFYGIAVRFPTGFPFSFGDFQLFEQLHQASGSGSPPVAFEARSNGIRLTGGFGLITPGSATGAHDQQLVASPALNTWHSLVYRVSNFSTSPNVSTIDVWWNGTQVLTNFTLPCPTLVTDTGSGSTGTYRKNGIYRSQDNTTALTIELAGHATGTTYAEVDPTSVAAAVPAKFVGGYLANWSTLLPRDLPTDYDLLFLAFATISADGTAVFTPSQNVANLKADIAANKSVGKPTILSIGGEGGAQNGLGTTADQDIFFNSVAAIIDAYGFSGIDWDLEEGVTGGISVTGLASLSRRLRTRYGSNFAVTMAPYVSTAAVYKQLATSIQDILTFVGYQFYNDSTVPTSSSVLATMNDWMTSCGLREDQFSLGFMHVDSWLTLTTPYATMASIYYSVNSAHPGVRGAWCWEISSQDQPAGYPFASTMSSVIDPLPTFVAPTPADALQNRVLTELRNWRSWLTANGARGMVGEWGVPTRYGQIGNTTEQGQWDALIEAYQDDLDAQGISGMMWASGREWFPEYTLAIHQGASRGAVLSVARQSVDSIVAAHPTRGGGTGTVWRGVGLSGHETGVSTSGGTAARTGTGFLHTASDFTYLASRGVDTVRIALGWERLQPTLSAALDTTALSALDVMIAGAEAVGIRVVLDLHNYGRYTLADGSVYALGGNLTSAMFSDFWTRMSTWVRADTIRSATVVGYGLMNEPHDLVGGAGTWETSSQAVVTAIRGGGDTRLIFVGGYSWSSLTDWVTTHADGWITDSASNYCYEAHHYFDTQSVLGSRSGTYQATLAGGDGAMLTYAAELASADPPAVASGNGRPGRRNLLPNPALAVDATGWTTTVTSGTGTASRVAVTGMDEPWAYQYAQTAAGTMYLESPRVAATPGLAYSGTIQLRYTALPDSALIAITFYNASGTAVGTSVYDSGATANTPKRLSVTRVAPATAATCAVRVYLFTGSPAAATTVVATAARIEQSDDPNLAYADGDTTGWSWLGTPGASPSRNPAALETARVNSVTNPYVVADLTGWVRWSYSGASTPTVTRTSVTGMDRPWAHRLTATGAHAFAVTAPKVAVTPGQGYSFTAQARFSLIPDVYAGIVLIYLKSDNTYLSEIGANERTSMTASVPYRSGLQQVVAPALAAFACIGFKWTTTTSTPTVDITAARGELGLDASMSYADGGTAGWTWDGAVGTSTSRSVPTAPVLPNYATSTESAFALSGRTHRRTVGIATTELDSARAVGRLRGGALVGTLADTFEAGVLDPQWTAQ